MTKPNFDRFLEEQLKNNTDISPNKDLWRGIEKGINQQASVNNKTSFWRNISAVAACVLLGLFSWQTTHKQDQKDTITNMSELFEQQKQSLLVYYKTQPSLSSDWQEQLQQLEDAEQAIKLVIEDNPENAVLISMLAQVYQQQLTLIKKVHAPRWQEI